MHIYGIYSASINPTPEMVNNVSVAPAPESLMPPMKQPDSRSADFLYAPSASRSLRRANPWCPEIKHVFIGHQAIAHLKCRLDSIVRIFRRAEYHQHARGRALCEPTESNREGSGEHVRTNRKISPLCSRMYAMS